MTMMGHADLTKLAETIRQLTYVVEVPTDWRMETISLRNDSTSEEAIVTWDYNLGEFGLVIQDD